MSKCIRAVISSNMLTHLSNIQVRLHDQERIGRVRTGRIRIIEEILHLRKSRLPESRAAIIRNA